MNFELINKLYNQTEISDKCWLWIGPINKSWKKTNGYGNVYINGKIYKVSRLSVSIYHRLDYNDKSWVACHICRERTCWNPLHLYAGTYKDNAMDAIKKGRHPSKFKTHCKRGHIFDKENTYITTDGRRNCKKCKKGIE